MWSAKKCTVFSLAKLLWIKRLTFYPCQFVIQWCMSGSVMLLFQSCIFESHVFSFVSRVLSLGVRFNHGFGVGITVNCYMQEPNLVPNLGASKLITPKTTLYLGVARKYIECKWH
jgi:hypothetical protein